MSRFCRGHPYTSFHIANLAGDHQNCFCLINDWSWETGKWGIAVGIKGRASPIKICVSFDTVCMVSKNLFELLMKCGQCWCFSLSQYLMLIEHGYNLTGLWGCKACCADWEFCSSCSQRLPTCLEGPIVHCIKKGVWGWMGWYVCKSRITVCPLIAFLPGPYTPITTGSSQVYLHCCSPSIISTWSTIAAQPNRLLFCMDTATWLIGYIKGNYTHQNLGQNVSNNMVRWAIPLHPAAEPILCSAH